LPGNPGATVGGLIQVGDVKTGGAIAGRVITAEAGRFAAFREGGMAVRIVEHRARQSPAVAKRVCTDELDADEQIPRGDNTVRIKPIENPLGSEWTRPHIHRTRIEPHDHHYFATTSTQ
jgi:hypothetical protein